ncbi:baseplate hub protein [Trabulsiella odontotermitis]|uniref:Tail protein n=1 Tax=Trabulsiella odontotermitis TaxID=379893 RepID=A0A0L0GZA4_9ENTR|nr:hypothetical protein [Trabulsiella odontotermitis]KNC94036.1 hypothetical protein GM31_16905 [Trabulsiella odontotermitis]
MYGKKELSFVFTGDAGTFDNKGTDKITIGNIRASAKLMASGNYSGFTAEIALYGLSAELLSMLSTKGTIGAMEESPGAVEVEIYSGKTQLFRGGIWAAYANMNAMPESSLMFNAVAGLSLRTNATLAFSQAGPVDLADMLSAIARAAGMGYRMVGVKGTINNPHFTGSAMQQIIDICSDYQLAYQIVANVLIVWPQNGTMDDVAPYVSPETGLVGYPVFSQSGIMFQTTFSPLLSAGRAVELKTSLPNASGRYILTTVEHMLTTWTEGGSWHSICQGFRISNE